MHMCDSTVSPSRSLVEFPFEERHNIFRHHRVSTLHIVAYVCDRAQLFEVRGYIRKFFIRMLINAEVQNKRAAN